MRQATSLAVVLAVFVPVLSLVGAPSCTDESIVLATLAAGPDAGDAGVIHPGFDAALPPPPDSSDSSDSCVVTADCPPGKFCSILSACGGATGICERIPDAGECNGKAMSPECGCDGVTYYNDCLRTENQTSLYASGGCDSQHTTSCLPDGGGCLATQKCAVLFPGGGFGGNGGGKGPSCSFMTEFPTTSCWVLPEVCPAYPDGPDRYDPCNPTQAGCLDTCQAISAGLPYHRDSNPACGTGHGN